MRDVNYQKIREIMARWEKCSKTDENWSKYVDALRQEAMESGSVDLFCVFMSIDMAFRPANDHEAANNLLKLWIEGKTSE